MTKSIANVSMMLAGLLAVIAFSQTTFAGPPLLCHPFEIGSTPTLPWSGTAWRDVKRDYDIRRLVDDTMALLTAETPVLVRMETMRRAAVYAVWAVVDSKTEYPYRDPKVAQELFARLQRRADEAKGRGGDAEALALFDLGYLKETYKQAGSNLGGEGLSLIVQASNLRHNDPQMEFAAAIVAMSAHDNSQQTHLRNALAGAPEGSLLARNLVEHFSDLGKTLNELRHRIG